MKTPRNKPKKNRQFNIYQDGVVEGVATLKDIYIEEASRIHGEFVFNEEEGPVRRWANLNDEIVADS